MTTASSSHLADPPEAPSPEAPQLQGRLGVVQLLFSVLAFNGPLAAVVGFSPVVIGYGNGLGAPVAFAMAGTLVALFAAGFTKLTRHVNRPGGFYSYVTLGLGREVGLGTAFLAMVCYYLLLLANFAFIGVSMQALVTGLLNAPDISWWVWALVTQAICAVLGYLQLDVSAKVLTVFLTAEVVIILIYDVAVVGQGGADGLSGNSFVPHEFLSGSVGLGLLFALFLMSGFEVTAIFRDEVRDPDRTIPRASYLFIVCVCATYGFTTWVLIQALGEKDAVAATSADPTGSFLGTVDTFVGRAGVDVVTALLCTSLLACGIATHNVLSRYVFNLAADGVLPSRLSAVHEVHGSPSRASMVVSGLSLTGLLVFIIASPDAARLYAQLSGGFSYGFIMMLVLTAVAIPAYFLRVQRPQGVTLWHAAIAPLLAFAGLATALYLATTNLDSLITAGGWVVAVLLSVLYGSVVLGAIVATALKRRRPEVYARIGRQ